MITYKLKVIYDDKTYKQKYGDEIDVINTLIALLEKGYITNNTYDEIRDFLDEMAETDMFNNAMIRPSNNIKLEMEMIDDDNDDYTIDVLLTHNS